MAILGKLLIGCLIFFVLFFAGCAWFGKAMTEQNKKDSREERVRNQTLAKASLIMEAVGEWSAGHYGALPSPTQFRSEVRPLVKGKSGADVTASEVEAAFNDFEWTFAGGLAKGVASETQVGRLRGPKGDSLAYADGSVRRDYGSR